MCTKRLPDGVTIVNVLPPESARHVGTDPRSLATLTGGIAGLAGGTGIGAEVAAGLSLSARAVNGGGHGIGRDTSTVVAGVRMCSVLPSELDVQLMAASRGVGGIGRIVACSTASNGGHEIGRITSV